MKNYIKMNLVTVIALMYVGFNAIRALWNALQFAVYGLSNNCMGGMIWWFTKGNIRCCMAWMGIWMILLAINHYVFFKDGLLIEPLSFSPLFFVLSAHN